MSEKESYYDMSLRVKGYGFHDCEDEYFKDFMTRNPDAPLEDCKKQDAEKICTRADGEKVSPIVIQNLEEFVREVGELTSSYENPLFYRGHGAANMLMCPSVLRDGCYQTEKRVIDNFMRKFPNEIKECSDSMQKLVLMRHFGLNVRCIDITENPFVALYFACCPMKKFNSNPERNKYTWSEVVIVRNPVEKDSNEKELSQPDDIKFDGSSTVSIMANSAFMKEHFSLMELSMRYKNDGFLSYEGKYMSLKDIVRNSVIIRTSQDNPRIKNQAGAFIMVNCNEIERISVNDSPYDDCRVSTDDLMTEIFEDKDGELSLNNLKTKGKFGDAFDNCELGDFHFKKVNAFSLDNKFKQMQDDPFDLNRLLYTNGQGHQVVFLIPPTAKEKIAKELEKFGFTEDFIYPDMDNVANELNLRIK